MAKQKPPIDLDIETATKPRERNDDELKIVLTDPIGRPKFHYANDAEKLCWVKEMVKIISHMQVMVKEKGIRPSRYLATAYEVRTNRQTKNASIEAKKNPRCV